MYKAIYKCRLCGECASEKRRFKLDDIMTQAFRNPQNIGMPLTSFHVCNDKSIGITDFQGFEETES